MSKSQSMAREEDFIRAYHDALLDIEAERPLMIDCTFHLTARRGVLAFSWEVFRLQSATPAVLPLCKYAAEYPNSHASSLGAFLYSCSVKLANLVDGAWEAATERPATKTA